MSRGITPEEELQFWLDYEKTFAEIFPEGYEKMGYK
jgi:hypothetical protein